MKLNNNARTSSCLFLVLTLVGSCFCSGWNYDPTSPYGPESWPEHYPFCNGTSQSPIDIVTAGVTEVSNTSPLIMTSYDEELPNQLFLLNNGHSVQVNIPQSSQIVLISQGGLQSVYMLEQFHFHWGETNSEGSEHTVNGKAYPLEIHFVHYKSSYTSVGDALANVANDTSALAVLGVFVQVSSDVRAVSEDLESLLSKLAEVTHEDDETELESGFSLDDFIPCDRTFFRYDGSLTTPTCNEVVVWTVFKNPIYVTADKLAEFRTLYATNSTSAEQIQLTHNFRPVQNLNGRTVSLYADPDGTERCNAKGSASAARFCPVVVVALNTLITLALLLVLRNDVV